MDFTTTLTSNKNITTNSPPTADNTTSLTPSTTTNTPAAVSAVTTGTPAIFISHKNDSHNNNNNNNNTNDKDYNSSINKHFNNTNIALSISPTSTLPINNNNNNNNNSSSNNNNNNSQSNDINHSMGNSMDLNKIRKDSIAHSQGVGGVSWGSLTIGSWLRDEVMLRGCNNNNNNNNSNNSNSNSYNNVMGSMIENHTTSNSNYTSHSKMYHANRNSISYRRLSTINKLNNPSKPIKMENSYDHNNNNNSNNSTTTTTNTDNKDIDLDSNKNNNHKIDSYSNFSLNASDHSDVLHLNSPPTTTSTYLPYLETQFCRDYSCCGLSLPGLHDLLRHYEEAHIGGIGYNSGFNNGNQVSYNYLNYGIKKQNNYLKQQYTKQQKSGLQEQLKSKNNHRNSSLSNNNLYNNNNTVRNENLHGSSTILPKSKNNVSNFAFDEDKNRDMTVRSNADFTTSKGAKLNNKDNSNHSNSGSTTGGGGENTGIHNNNSNSNSNTSIMGTGMDIGLVNNDLLGMEFDPSGNHGINRIPNRTSHNSTNNVGSNQNLRSSSVPSSVITQGPLNIGSDSTHLDLSHDLGVMDADSHHDNEMEVENDGGGNDIDMDSHIRSVDNNSNNNNHNNINIISGSGNSNNSNMTMNKNNNSFHNLKESVNSLDVTTNSGHNFHNILIENSDSLNNLLIDSFSMPQIHLNDNTNTHNIGNNNTSNNNINNHGHDVLDGISNNQAFMEDTIHNETSVMTHQDPLSNLHSNNDDDMDNDDMNNDGNRVNFIDDPARRLYVMDHEEHKPFKCPVIGCEKTYKNQNGLKYHRLHGHQNQKLLENPDGTFTVLDPDSNEPYPEGLGYEKDKPYRCEVCGKRYKNLNGLKYHRGHSTH